MDSLTQIALGGAVGHAVLGSRTGRKAALWGGILGTLPDLDVVVRFADPVSNFIYHRSASHSLLILTLAAPLLAWLISRVQPLMRETGWRLYLMVWLVLITHTLLDALTVYGTQLFWPITDYPVSISSMFIIDPLYTLPLLVGLVIALRHPFSARGHRANILALALSTLYLAWGLGIKQHIDHKTEQWMAANGIEQAQVLSVPAPLNTLLWRSLVMQEDHYYELFYSLLDGERLPTAKRWENRPDLLAQLAEHRPVQRLARFTHGFFDVVQVEDEVWLRDLRMGQLNQPVFNFKVAQWRDGELIATPAKRRSLDLQSHDLGWSWRRLTDASQDW